MPVALQLDRQLVPAPPIELDALEESLAVVAALTSDERLQQQVCVRVCTAAESQSLNETYRNIDKPTNVLSFPADVPEHMFGGEGIPDVEVPLGDIAICWPVVEAEAGAQGKCVFDHFTHLYVHGLLHLLDFDHENEGQAEVMEALEVRILARLGLANPYSPSK